MNRELLGKLLRYDPQTGEFVWLERTQDLFDTTPRRSAEWICNNWNARHAGKIAGFLSNHGYLRIRIFGKAYFSHTLAWIYVYSAPPLGFIDHADRNKTNNRIANLRLATKSQNAMNAADLGNKTGYRGVTKISGYSLWHAQICVNGKRLHLGTFSSPEEASAAYNAAAKMHFDEFAPDYLVTS